MASRPSSRSIEPLHQEHDQRLEHIERIRSVTKIPQRAAKFQSGSGIDYMS